MELLFKNVTTVDAHSIDVRISGDGIVERGQNLTPKKKEHVADLEGHFLYAGLVNWHDHLEMNLYPRLGTPPYNNYTEWMKDIYKPKESPLKEIEKTDIDYRLMWGGIKNMISGATTVYHHNPSRRANRKDSFPVFVPKIEWSHSLAVEKKFRTKGDLPFIIHAGEGVDEFARQEIYKLDELGLLGKNTFIVHGVGCRSPEFAILEKTKTSLIWCPASNLYMFNKTADVAGRKNIFLGTDSTLTGSPTLLDEMRVASGFIPKRQIFDMVSRDSKGFFITPKKKDDPVENLFSLQPKDISLVVNRGKIRMQDKSIGFPALKKKIVIQGEEKQTDIDVDKLKMHFEKKVGTKILEQNALWRLI